MLNIKQKLVHIFRNNRVMKLQDLQRQLNNRSRRSTFRDLINEGYYSSYTHAGKYYTLRHIVDFNSDGLWFYKDIGFSKYGTLKNTTIFLVNCSKAGKTHDELKKLLRLRVHNTLLELVKIGKLAREKINHNYVYINTEGELAKQQLNKRRLLCVVKNRAIELPSELIQIRIFVEIIKSSMVKIEPALLAARLKACGERITAKEVERVLIFYGLKKN